MYCAGAKAMGIADGNTDTCKEAIKKYTDDNGNLDKELTMSNLDVKLSEDTTISETTYDSTKEYSKEITLKLSGEGYNNIKTLFANSKYQSLKNNSSIIVTGCSVDAVSRNAGFSCKLSGSNKNLLNGDDTQKVIVENNNMITNNTEVNITLKISYKVPFDVSNMAVLTCSQSKGNCSNYSDVNKTQRMVWINENQEQTSNVTISLNAPSACEFSVDENDNPVYKLKNKVVSEADYLNAGCCNVDPSYLQSETSTEHFLKFCQAEDIVHLEKECGTKTKLSTKIDKIAGSDVETITCSNESYIDYTHSYVWQLSMDKVMDRVSTLENGAYSSSIIGIYNNSAVENYLDKSYLGKSINGKTISGGNNYCMAFTSEYNDIYFPGTSVATSGRFFIFNELKKNECLNSLNPGTNCFRQPYVKGKINVTMHTNFTKWDSDYTAAINDENTAYDNWQKCDPSILITEINETTGEETQIPSCDKNILQTIYNNAKTRRVNLETYKQECESHNDLVNNWKYELSPDVNFKYKQSVYAGSASDMLEEEVPMAISDEGVKYWPNATTEAKNTSSSGTYQKVCYETNDGEKCFDKTSDYKATFEQTVYYRPEQATYATIPSGQTVLSTTSYSATSSMIENGISVGYVYNVKLTTYQGAYTTSFKIDNLGHTDSSEKSNVQKSMDKYVSDNGYEDASSECVYCNQESEYKRQCDECPDPTNPNNPTPMEADYVYRTVSLADVTPNERANTNWSDAKGTAAEARIQDLSGPNIVAMLTKDKSKEIKAVTLNESKTSDAKLKVLANDSIYDDNTKEYLEYEFVLNTKDMQTIKKNTARSTFDYANMTLCTNSDEINNVEKSENKDYCFKCNADGKECQSTFVTAFAEASDGNYSLTNTRINKWKYYINNKWEIGSMDNIKAFKWEFDNLNTIEGFTANRYPDPINQEYFLKVYSNWP